MNISKELLICLALTSPMIVAENFEVKLLTTDNKGQTMIFEPAFIKISKGDSITFIPSDPTHNAESFSTSSDKSTFNTPMGKTSTITFSEEGVVLYKCLPHFALGMVGVIQVGEKINKAKAIKDWQKVKAGVVMNQQRMDQYLAQIK